ncbi:uncharacterized protein LOC130929442 [Corythoichthys intestinalis]|uniref:uncharacterized protein LOC130929442 n=1 Tax=Corythoichthys intestinalis TaxID=161448 RepID=UPI0025A63CC2|nr:uncharacterized protein LOC130929442 [Corythoichthys intestinalis]
MSRLLVVLLASATCRAGVLPDGTAVRVDAHSDTDERRRSQLINGTNRLDSAASDPSTFYLSYLEENGSRPIIETPPWAHAFLVSPLQMPPAGPLGAHRVDMPEAGRVMPPNAFHWPDVVGTGLTQSAKIPTEESEGAAPDPFNWENGTPPWAQMPPHLVNIPEGSESLRMLRTGGVATPPNPDMTICDMLLKSTVSPQTPVWCLCLQCESSARPPGECGEPGPSGMYTI